MNLDDIYIARYEAGGRGPRAYDCFGLFAEVCRRRGVAVPEHPTPDDLREREDAIAAGAQADWVPLDGPEPWCGVALRIGPFVAHMGIVLEDGLHFLHASQKTGITRVRLDDPRWQKRIAGFYRHV